MKKDDRDPKKEKITGRESSKPMSHLGHNKRCIWVTYIRRVYFHILARQIWFLDADIRIIWLKCIYVFVYRCLCLFIGVYEYYLMGKFSLLYFILPFLLLIFTIIVIVFNIAPLLLPPAVIIIYYYQYNCYYC